MTKPTGSRLLISQEKFMNFKLLYEVKSINARIKKISFNFSSFCSTFYSGRQYHLRALITNIVILCEVQKDRRRVNGTIDVA